MSSDSAVADSLETGQIVWCGGIEVDQDVSIRLVPSGTDLAGCSDSEIRDKTLVLVKIHSRRLSQYSKYFETCLSERWRKPNPLSTVSEFFLEVHSDVEYYTACFSRMYSPFQKDFGEIKHSVELLKVASQIEFHELMDSISRYISAIHWSSEDEVRIREYSYSPDFHGGHATDLIARLGLHMNDRDRYRHLCDVYQYWIRSAMSHNDNFKNTRTLIEEFLHGIGSGTPVNVAKTVVTIVSNEAKNTLSAIDKEHNETLQPQQSTIFKLAQKLLAVCWVLRSLLNARVAEELVLCIVHMEDLPSIVIRMNYFNAPHCNAAGMEMARLILRLYTAVLEGDLLLSTAERVALLKNWHVVLESFVSQESYHHITKSFFLTLPLGEQTELIKSRQDMFVGFIDISSLVALLRESWPDSESD